MSKLFALSYKCSFNSDNTVVTLTPTLQTWMQAFAPSIVIGVGSVGLAMAVGWNEDRKLKKIARNSRID